MEKTKIYKSKISWILLLILCIAIGGSIIFMAIEGAWLSMGINILVAAFIAHMFANTYYAVEGRNLHIRCGILINTNIDISSIKSIQHTNSILSAPALSLDRLVIKYNKYDEVVISPKDKEGFIKSLLAIHPGIESVTRSGN